MSQLTWICPVSALVAVCLGKNNYIVIYATMVYEIGHTAHPNIRYGIFITRKAADSVTATTAKQPN